MAIDKQLPTFRRLVLPSTSGLKSSIVVRNYSSRISFAALDTARKFWNCDRWYS